MAWLLIAHATVFLGTRFIEVFHPGLNLSHLLNDLFGMSRRHFLSGKVWTLVTYSFLHGDFFHIAINMLIIFGIGRSLQAQLGEKKFLILYFAGVIFGGIFILFLDLNGSMLTIGASGGALALITVYCFERWEMPVTLLFFEITFKMKWLFYVILGWQLMGYLLPLLGQASGGGGIGPVHGISHTAHLGGIAGGVLFYKYFMHYDLFARKPRVKKRNIMSGWIPKKKKYRDPSRASEGPAPTSRNKFDRKSLQKEVDRILDKINSQGFGALSEEEKRTLDRARDILSH